MSSIRSILSLPMIAAVAAALLLTISCDEDGTVCPDDGAGPQTPVGWFDQSPTEVDIYYGAHAFDANTVVAVGEEGVVVRTTDGGKTWTHIDSGTSERLSAVSFVDESTGWAVGVNSVILKTSDGGLTWTPQDPIVTTHFRDVYFLDENTGWAAAASWGVPNIDGYVINTTDGGKTWTPQLLANSNGVFFVDADTGCANAIDGAQRSTDGGETWTFVDLGITGPTGSLFFADSTTGWLTERNGAIFKTTDAGRTWSPQADGTDRTISDIFFVDSDRGWYIAGTPGTIATTFDGGDTWTFQTCPTTSGPLKMSFVDENVGWIVGYDGIILKTVTGGQ